MSITQGLCAYNPTPATGDTNLLFAAWKGETGNEQLYYATFNGSDWNSQTANQTPIPGAVSSIGPSLAWFNNKLYAAWKNDSDETLWYASFDGTRWSGPAKIPGVASFFGPSLALFDGYLFAAWRGLSNDQSLWYAKFDGSTWSGQTPGTHQTPITISAVLGGGVPPPVVSSFIGPSLAVFNGTLYAAWRGAIFDQGIYYASFSGTKWSAPNVIPKVGTSIGPSIAQFGSSLYVVWKGDGTDERLFYGYFNAEMQWQGGQQIAGIPFTSSIGAALSTFGNKLYAIWKGADSDEQISCASFDGASWTTEPTVPGNTGQDMAPLPVEGLGSDSNYILSANCQPITALTIQIDITQAIVSNIGFSFQLNCYTTQDQKDAWQQYILCYLPNLAVFGCQVDNWTTASELINSGISYFCNFQGPDVPAGTVLEISLVFDPNNQKVTGANFSVSLPGASTKSQHLMINTLNTDAGTLANESDMSPIAAFQVDLVGPDGATTLLSAGGGNITYTASPALTAVADFPSCIEYDEPTGEKANSAYGQLPLGSSMTFTQSFAVDVPPPPPPPSPAEATCSNAVREVEQMIANGIPGPRFTVAEWAAIQQTLAKCVMEGNLTQAFVSSLEAQYLRYAAGKNQPGTPNKPRPVGA